jgi:beta-xylosidase
VVVGRRSLALVAMTAALGSVASAQPVRSGNPVIQGWYADPEGHVFEGRYWIYPTYSAPYDQQVFMDAFSSTDLVTWTKHPRIIDTSSVKWARRAVWAPSIVQKDGWYYLFFGANDIQNDQERGGIGVARSRRPEGPFVDYLGKPLIDAFHNGAQPIDQNVFRDRDGSYYIVYGGWRHCNIAKLNDDFTGFVPFPDGTTFREITPNGYVEGAYMLLKDDSTTSCGRRAGGPARITRSPMRSVPRPLAPSSGWGRSCSRTRQWPRERVTIPSCTRATNGTSSTTAGRSARLTATIASSASTSWNSMIAA